MGVRGLVRLARPHQWAKNLLVFTGLLFTASFRDPEAWRATVLAFLAMGFVSSGFYAWNDVRDRDRDRSHPRKKRRPVASGEVSPPAATIFGAALLVLGVFLLWPLPALAQGLVAVYGAVQVAYNAGLRAVPVLDACAVGSGFVIRAALGAAAMGVRVSGWLLLCAGALALLVSLGKRRAEHVALGSEGVDSRPSLAGYTRESLDAMVTLSATASVLCYGLYALESETARQHPGLFLTVPFVAYGVMRYLLLVFQGQDTASEPDLLFLRDPHLIGTALLFLLASVVAMTNALPGGIAR
ncbi:MAG: UbiA prenyltransferase family protein [Fimbriimonadales bacterium]|nr:UbiA prenyltransferase family protein [Fimbriimonadales bacterium]